MPEGHVIHRLANQFSDTFGGELVRVTSPQGRFDAGDLDGALFERGEAVGKHLFLDFEADRVVHIHLGLIGKLAFAPLAPPKGEVRLRVSDLQTAADLRGPQWCRRITPDERDAVVAASGPDPLRDDADPVRGFTRLHRSGKSVAALLMDQKVAAGVGNIFRAEVLFRHRLDPTVPGKELPRRSWDLLWADLVDLMHRAVLIGRIDTVAADHTPEAMARDPRVDRHGGEVYVYRRAGQPCLVCGTEIRTAMLEGRHLYWCPRCQRRRTAGPTPIG
ncbi:Fpg/Nei family DNA glycosylase [Tessaracoccus palaemonis]|uniref:Fpg/Nei family DNA glycosylase n=1 Tax=Tessaracoccus palaemonis TaxID=2829499 RepID=A0ABX8SKD2_9ACTN|nr:zinc finger domain-containing protein [Tessaracoccus palaemonis]QXT63788.1 Fpg/Nei family DNA glycosylase [Tessaracoccus palaemonis]